MSQRQPLERSRNRSVNSPIDMRSIYPVGRLFKTETSIQVVEILGGQTNILKIKLVHCDLSISNHVIVGQKTSLRSEMIWSFFSKMKIESEFDKLLLSKEDAPLDLSVCMKTVGNSNLGADFPYPTFWAIKGDPYHIHFMQHLNLINRAIQSMCKLLKCDCTLECYNAASTFDAWKLSKHQRKVGSKAHSIILPQS